jgi:class 3 adenylate cyclase
VALSPGNGGFGLIVMSNGTEQRRLAAIMFTDMVGYSALTQRNEALALQLLEEHRRLLRELFPKFGGREVETTGDGFLLEFASALEAAKCAIEIQRSVATRNLTVPPERKIQLRIGIHVGDVVHKDGHVLGDGVNIAARLQPLAEPGGICISVDVARQVQNNLQAAVVKVGDAELKNIRLPMEICRIVLPWEKPETSGQCKKEFIAGHWKRWRLMAGIPTLLVAVIGLLVWRDRVPWPRFQHGVNARIAQPTLAPQQAPWDLSVKKITPASIRIDLVGVNVWKRPAWEGYDMDQYWRVGDARRANADKLTLEFTNDEPVIVSRDHPKWRQWFQRGATELMLIADLPGHFTSGPSDPRRVFLPLDKTAWKGHRNTLLIEVQDSLIRVAAP